uniref:Putative regulator of nonsense transcripts 3a n=1 Tax=Amblyomma triste TaxID=251400 RepID=A0A023GKT9_AMBTT
MTQEKAKDDCSPRSRSSSEASKSKEKKDRSFLTKVVIRRLPPTMTEEQFLEQISPVPESDYMYFVKGDKNRGPHAFSRAYINFVNQDEIFIFKEKFDDYIFIDEKGNEYPALVEYAPFQKIPKRRTRKKDPKCGTIEQDPEYIKFLESLEQPEEVTLPSIDTYIEEIEAREKEMKANNGCLKVVTPLIEYLQQRKLEKLKLREERREERKRREVEKKRLRDEEKRRRKVDRDRASKESSVHREIGSSGRYEDDLQSDEVEPAAPRQQQVVKVLRNPVREHEPPPAPASKDVGGGGVVSKSNSSVGHSKAPVRSSVGGSGGISARKEWDRPKPQQRPPKDYQPTAKEYSKHKSEQPASTTHRRGSAGSDGRGSQETSTSKASAAPAADEERPAVESSRGAASASAPAEGKGTSSEKDRERPSAPEESSQSRQKDPRAERRIRNKDRPSIEIYRPGMRRLSQKPSSAQEETSVVSAKPSKTTTKPSVRSTASTAQESN